ncbi:hypothetical protein ZHAS_00021382 [Anopheles sinensis]|uniref:Uncharacterized protein n=1 Tax=Anopheles sinensis TaxID=74873 RepID=A0A084WS96_ANOSI|nr:hypothetical protein ZHAS_00021382 [Anopheles sinensis]
MGNGLLPSRPVKRPAECRSDRGGSIFGAGASRRGSWTRRSQIAEYVVNDARKRTFRRKPTDGGDVHCGSPACGGQNPPAKTRPTARTPSSAFRAPTLRRKSKPPPGRKIR